MENKREVSSQNKFYLVYLIGFLLIVALPVLGFPPWFFPPSWGKAIFFRIILSIMTFFVLWQLLAKKYSFSMIQRIIQRGSAVRMVVLLLIALFSVFFLATLFSLDLQFSLWGSPYRGGGFLNFAFYIIFAILAFFILRPKDWEKVWIVAFIAGILVSLIAIFQKFEILTEVLIPRADQPSSTIGGPIFLALYILLLSFLALSFGIKEKGKKKFFYFSSFFIFIFTIFIAVSRASYLGLAAGFLYFLFLYPAVSKKLTWLKIFFGILLVLGIFGIYWLNTQPQFPQFIQENKILEYTAKRVLIGEKFFGLESRFSSWKVSLNALKERPILGYGPENFSIGFDKYYDPSLPGITFQPGGPSTGWWDRAHNFIFDISLTAGIPALIIYLSLFAVLFWQLQKLKHTKLRENEHENTQKTIIAHGIQATFLAYLVANFFSFDVFSTYLVLFLLVGYSLHLISSAVPDELTPIATPEKAEKFSVVQRIGLRLSSVERLPRVSAVKTLFIILLFGSFVGFIYFYNFKPLQINQEINWANFYSGKGDCKRALEKMESILPSKSSIDHYVRLSYADVIKDCINQKPERKTELAQKATEILKENAEMRPYYTRNWLLLGTYTIIKNGQEELEEAAYYFEKANQLSPKRQEISKAWWRTLISTDLKRGRYQEAKEKAQKCIEINPEFKDCWWLKGISHIYLGEIKAAEENIKTASEKGYPIDSKDSLLQLAKAYGNLAKTTEEPEHYQTLVDIYQKLIDIDHQNFQHHASLAFVYKTLGQYEKAREEAFIVLELSPESKENVEEFLKTLP